MQMPDQSAMPGPFEPDHAAQFALALGGRGRLLGLDLGTKTIGIAICDENWSVASPVTTLQRTKFTKDVEYLSQLLDREQGQGIVMGLPVNMDGSEGPRAQSTRAFVRNMARNLAMPVLFWDERWSTVAADRSMLQAGLSRKKRADRVDQLAATFILQGAADRLRLEQEKAAAAIE